MQPSDSNRPLLQLKGLLLLFALIALVVASYEYNKLTGWFGSSWPAVRDCDVVDYEPGSRQDTTMLRLIGTPGQDVRWVFGLIDRPGFSPLGVYWASRHLNLVPDDPDVKLKTIPSGRSWPEKMHNPSVSPIVVEGTASIPVGSSLEGRTLTGWIQGDVLYPVEGSMGSMSFEIKTRGVYLPFRLEILSQDAYKNRKAELEAVYDRWFYGWLVLGITSTILAFAVQFLIRRSGIRPKGPQIFHKPPQTFHRP
jgi:hypothetical protein